MTYRAPLLLTAVASLLTATTPALAQVPDGVVINIMRECAKIGDATARLACYDNNIRQAGGSPSAVSSAPIHQGAPASTPAPAPNAQQEFGLPARPAPPVQQAQTEVRQVEGRVRSVREREPGVYAITLEDGAEWRFAQSAPRSYRVPSQGSTVRIERGSLGSFLLRFDNQAAVPVRRVQ